MEDKEAVTGQVDRFIPDWERVACLLTRLLYQDPPLLVGSASKLFVRNPGPSQARDQSASPCTRQDHRVEGH